MVPEFRFIRTPGRSVRSVQSRREKAISRQTPFVEAASPFAKILRAPLVLLLGLYYNQQQLFGDPFYTAVYHC